MHNIYIAPLQCQRKLSLCIHVVFIMAVFVCTGAEPASHFGRGEGFIQLDELSCNGSEVKIVSCRHGGVGVHDCDHSQDAGVICHGIMGCMDSAVLHLLSICMYHRFIMSRLHVCKVIKAWGGLGTRLPVCTICKVIKAWGGLGTRLPVCKVIKAWGGLGTRLPVCKVIKAWGGLGTRLPVCKVIKAWGGLGTRLPVCKVQ